MKTIRWLSVAIALLALMGSGGWLYYQIQGSGVLKAENAQLKATLQIAAQAAEKNRQAHLADRIRAQQDEADKIALRGQLREVRQYVSRLENGGGECLNRDDVEQLRRLWNIDPAPDNPTR
jgi:uncharacterized protein HemX